MGIPFVDGGGMAFAFNALDSAGDRKVVHSEADGEDIVVFWDRSSKAAVAFRTTVGGQALTFGVVEGRYIGVETGSEWTLEGRAISGSMEGQRLVQVPEAYVSFWFAWATFVPDTGLWLTQKPVPELARLGHLTHRFRGPGGGWRRIPVGRSLPQRVRRANPS